jgi:small subunit ribosomal protein S15
MTVKKGDVVSQIAVLTTDINKLSEHIKVNKKDFATKRTLYRLVSRKKKYLNYLKENDYNKYIELTKKK